MQTHTNVDAKVTLSESDIEQLLDKGVVEGDGVTIKFYGN